MGRPRLRWLQEVDHYKYKHWLDTQPGHEGRRGRQPNESEYGKNPKLLCTPLFPFQSGVFHFTCVTSLKLGVILRRGYMKLVRLLVG
jgi:hypothetical protein